MARNASELNRKVLQNIRTRKNSSQIEGMLSGVIAEGEIAVQLGDYGSGDTGTSLWTLASDGVTAVRFVNQHYVDARVSGSAGALGEEIDKIEASVGLSTGGTLPTNWKEGTTYMSASTTVIDALQDLDKAIKDIDDSIIDELEVDKVNTNTDKIVYDFAQHKGLVGSAQTKNVGEFTLAGYTVGGDDSADVAATDTLNEAIGKLQGQINGMDKTGTTEDGKVVTYVTEADGKVSENKEFLTSIKLNGYTGTTGNVTANDTVGQAIDKIEKEILSAKTATSVASADGSITVATADTGTDIAVNIKSGEKVLAKTGSAGLYTDIKLQKITDSLPAEVKERYQLTATDGSKLGDFIDVPKDSHIVSINYITNPADAHYQNLEYVYIDASGATQTTYVDMSSLVLEAEFESGVTVTNHIVHGVVDPQSEHFLTVGADGFKLAGVQDAIDAAKASGKTEIITTVAGDATKTHMGISATTAADGHTVYTFGLYDVASAEELANLSGTVLNLDSTVSGKSTHVNVEIVETDGKLTSVTLGETDIASASALTAEVTRAKAAEAALDTVIGSEKPGTGETRTYSHTNTKYLNDNDNVKDDVETIDAILGKYDDGTTATTYDVTFDTTNTVAKSISDLKKEIDEAKSALELTATDDNKYIAATVTPGATGTTINVVGVARDIATSTSATTGIADAYNVKQFAVSAVKDNASNGALTRIAVVTEDDVKKLDVSNLCIDCGTF